MDTRAHSLIGRLLRPRAESTLERLLLDTYGGNVSTSGQSVTPNSAMRVGAVYACVNVLAQSVGQLPLHLYRQDGETRDKAVDHPLYRLLYLEPNGWMTSQAFKQLIMVQLCLRGNSVWLRTRGLGGRLRELIPIHPDRLHAIQQDESYRIWYHVKRPPPSTEVDKIPEDSILHFRGLSFDGMVGINPITYAREMIGLAMAQEKHGAKLFTSGTRLSGLLLYPGKLKDETAKRLRESWEDMYTGIAGAHRTAILEEGMKFERLSMTAEDAQFIEARKYQRSEIAGLFRVPAHLINDLERATFSNIEHQAISFATHTLAPWLVSIEQQLAKALLTDAEKLTHYFRFRIEGLMRGDSKSQGDYYQRAIQTGWMNPNEVRELNEYNPYPGGEVFRVAMNTTPADGTPAEERDEIPQQQER